jgi:hypothetical protein
LSKFWLKGIKKSFTDKNIVLVSGKNLPLFEAKPLTLVGSQWNSSKKENITGYLGILDLGDEEKEIDPLLVYGCNFSIRKKILLEAGGFHPDGFPQDLCKYRGDGETYISQFVKNLGSKTWYSPIVSVAHLVSMEKTTLKYYRKRSFNQGISDSFTYIRSIKGNHLKIFNKLILDLFRFIKCLILFNITTYKKYHLLGIIYHQINCLKDKSLMQYVLKENYLE